MILVSNKGTRIIGTLEVVYGVSYIENVSSPTDYEHSGYTDIWWDGQMTVVRDGKTVFVDENGDEFTENEVHKVEDSEPYFPPAPTQEIGEALDS
jgi:hypothetical protein